MPGLIRAADLWLPGLIRDRWEAPGSRKTTDVMIAVCDHFEPKHRLNRASAMERIARWHKEYPGIAANCRDADNIGPRHTFFFPIEQYDRDILDRLADLCRETGAEIELHLHHENDTAAGLRQKLERGKEDLARHGGLAVDARGRIRFGFIHGNWALAHSHPQARFCGVPEELDILQEAGCYADFTMPSAPDRTQSRMVNRIYYAGTDGVARPHDRGVRATVQRAEGGGQGAESKERNAAGGSQRPESGGRGTKIGNRRTDGLLLVQGPLGLNWERRKWGLLPRLENGEITGTNPPTPDRLRLWLRLGIHVEDRPEWIFVKLHTHGGDPRNMTALLGGALPRFHEHLLATCSPANGIRVHFVTAREMTNIVHAAEDGGRGDAGRYRDYLLQSRMKVGATKAGEA